MGIAGRAGVGTGDIRMKKIVAAAAAFLAMSGAAFAQFQYDITNPSGTVRNFDAANLGPVLTELGMPWQIQTNSQTGQPGIAVSYDNIIFYIVPAACQGQNFTNCIGAQIFALFTSEPVNQQTVNAFNLRYSFGSTGPLQNGFYVSRYEIADFGIARGNVESSIDSFVNLTVLANREFTSGANTVSALGFADDMSAGLLNEASARAIGVEQPFAGGVVGHMREVREMPERIRAFAASPEARFNKIDNRPSE